ncbi:40S ribosomal protein S5-1 [Hordeum vulgare]|nr:40S ribosomal protein S5-1 [Hordeum vulgare]
MKNAMTSPRPSKDNFFEKVINPYLPEVMKQSQAIEMHAGVLHIRDVQGPNKEGSEKARFAMVEHEIFKCQGIVEHGLSAKISSRKTRCTQRTWGIFSLSFKIGLITSKIKSMNSKAKTMSRNLGFKG